MTTQIHKCHPRDTEEQLYNVPLHDVELHDVANVRHKSVGVAWYSMVLRFIAWYCMVLHGIA